MDPSVDCSHESIKVEAVETLEPKVFQIRKRDGRVVNFDSTKITNAIFKELKQLDNMTELWLKICLKG